MVDKIVPPDANVVRGPDIDMDNQYQTESAEMPPVAREQRDWDAYAKSHGLDRSTSGELEEWRSNAANNSRPIQAGYMLIDGSARKASADDLMHEEIERVNIPAPESGEPML